MANKDLAYYMKLPYQKTISFETEDGENYIIATIKELPGLLVVGDSIEEIQQEIQDAKEVWFLMNLKLGRQIQEPATYNFSYRPSINKEAQKLYRSYSRIGNVKMNRKVTH